MPLPARARGFTLLEMLVVLALIGITMGIVAFGVGKGLHAASERRALTQLVQGLRSARVQAIVSARPAKHRTPCRPTWALSCRPPRRWAPLSSFTPMAAPAAVISC
jgi:prepilin-type N-terminal cleavage/methylation domain-containing protein